MCQNTYLSQNDQFLGQCEAACCQPVEVHRARQPSRIKMRFVIFSFLLSMDKRGNLSRKGTKGFTGTSFRELQGPRRKIKGYQS